MITSKLTTSHSLYTMTTAVQQVQLLVDGFILVQRLEWTGLQLDIILNYLLSLSLRAALHDITTLFLCLGVLVNNVLNTALVALLNRPRPEPYNEAGQPCREIQAISFMAAYYLVYIGWWPKMFDILTATSLGGIVAWAWLALELGGHYFRSQIVGGVFVGSLVGYVWAYIFHTSILPRAPRWVAWWNSCTPTYLHVTHAFHYHPDRDCLVKECDGYCILYTGDVHLGTELGYGHLPTTLIRFLVIALIHL